MTINYTTNLALSQPVTGTESGTWGDITNNALAAYVDIAVAGTLTLSGDGAVTLANTQGTSAGTNIGSTTAQYASIRITGSLTTTKVITAPSSSKIFVVSNASSTPQSVTFKASGQTGVTIVQNEIAQVIFNGTDYVKVAANPNTNGQLAGLRNRIINGAGLVRQRGVTAITGALQYGQADRMMVSISGGATGISGNITAGSLGGASTGQGWGLTASWTGGAAQLAQRIESSNVLDMNGQTITFSGKLYQDTGGTRTMNILIQKATAGVDNFSTTSTIASTTLSLPNNVTTSFSFTATLGASDATNGLMVIVADTATNTVTSKTYYASDWQLELGSVATPFEQRPIGMELALCQRYYSKSYSQNTSPGTATSTNSLYIQRVSTTASDGFGVRFPITMRTTPTTAAVYSTSTGASGNIYDTSGAADVAATVNNMGDCGFAVGWSAVASRPYTFHYAASAEL